MTLLDQSTEDLLTRALRGGTDAALEAADSLRAISVSDPSRAIELSRQIARSLPPGSRAIPRVLASCAHAQCYANDFAGADETLARALQEASRLDDDREVGFLMLTRVQPLARLGRLDEALHAAQQALALLERSGETFHAGRAATNTGIVLRMLGRCEEALVWFQRASAPLAPDASASAALRSNEAETLLDLDRFDEAGRSFEAALAGFSALGHQHACAIVEGNLADLDSRAGRVDSAVVRFESARARFERINANADACRLLAEQAEALQSIGANHKCQRLYERAIPVLESAGLTRELLRARLGHALALVRLGKSQRALDVLSRTIEDAEACGAGLVLTDARLARAEALLSLGRAEESRCEAIEALTNDTGRGIWRARALTLLAHAELVLGRGAEAESRLAEAWSAQGAELAPVRSRIEHVRGLVRERAGDHAAALEHLTRSIALAERVRGAIRAEQLRLSCLESYRGLYLDACRVALDHGSAEACSKVFGFIELMRARTLMDSTAGVASGPVTHGGPDDHELRECVAALNTSYSRLGLGEPSRRQGDAAVRRQVLDLEARLDRLLDRQLSGAGAGASGARPLSLQEAQQRLNPASAAVLYFREGDRLSALVVRREGCAAVRRFVALEHLASIGRRLEFAVDQAMLPGRSGDDPLRPLLAKLHESLLAPLFDEIGDAQHLVLVPSAELHSLPLLGAAALDGRGASLAPGLSIGLRMAESAAGPSPAGSTLIVGVRDQWAPGMAVEASEIAQRLPGTHLLTGDDASAENFLDSLPGASVLHLAAHAVYDAEFPLSSRVKLADRWVTAREIAGRLRPGALAVLAGCETGRTTDWSGEDRLGLIRAFLASGAASVVASLWRLPDEPARALFVELMSRTHASGRPMALAASACLSSLQHELARERAPAAHWAGLICKGAIT